MLDIATQAQNIAKICGDALIRAMLNRLVELELGRFDLAIKQTRQELTPFETHFNKDSLATLKTWHNGNYAELADDGDLMEWMALTENLQLLLNKKAKLIASIQE